jgi:hypothetical protein
MAHDNCASSTGERRRRHGGGVLSWHYPSRLGWLQFKPVRGVVSDADVEKTLKKRNPAKGGE